MQNFPHICVHCSPLTRSLLLCSPDGQWCPGLYQVQAFSLLFLLSLPSVCNTYLLNEHGPEHCVCMQWGMRYKLPRCQVCSSSGKRAASLQLYWVTQWRSITFNFSRPCESVEMALASGFCTSALAVLVQALNISCLVPCNILPTSFASVCPSPVCTLHCLPDWLFLKENSIRLPLRYSSLPFYPGNLGQVTLPLWASIICNMGLIL